jgi:hypothetical protein
MQRTPPIPDRKRMGHVRHINLGRRAIDRAVRSPLVVRLLRIDVSLRHFRNSVAGSADDVHDERQPKPMRAMSN